MSQAEKTVEGREPIKWAPVEGSIRAGSETLKRYSCFPVGNFSGGNMYSIRVFTRNHQFQDISVLADFTT